MITVALAFTFSALALTPLHVSGTRLLDAQNRPFRIRGINVPGLEWNALGENVPRTVGLAVSDWKANLVRIPLSQDRWFGKAPDSPDDGTKYRALVEEAVSAANSRGAYALLDLHWSDCGQLGKNIGQHTLPDSNSVDFWRACAKQYANRPGVLFDLYNEPIETTWEIWRNGGAVTETVNGSPLTYQAVGLQTLLTAIRSVGAKNLVVAGGLGYSSRLDMPVGLELKDPSGNGVLYANHFYPGWENEASWEPRMIAAEKRFPLLIGEFGSSPEQLPYGSQGTRVGRVLSLLKKHDWNWIAWCMHPQASPCLISDWNYTPTPYFGALVKAALAGKAVPIPARKSTAPDVVVFDEKLGNQWSSWSSAKVDLNSTRTVHSGTKAIEVQIAPGQEFQLGVVPMDGAMYSAITFWINGGEQGGQHLSLCFKVMNEAQKAVDLPIPAAHEWKRVTIPFSELGVAGLEDLKSFSIRVSSGQPGTFFLDDIVIRGK